MVAAVAVAISSCGSEDEAPPVVMSASSSGAVCPTGSTLTYEGFAQQFFEDYCTRCHSTENSGTERNRAPVGYDWDDYDSIALHAADIDNVAAAGPRATNTFMPPAEPRPTTAERAQLGEWLACEFAPGMP